MFLLFTPFTFLYLVVYIMFLFSFFVSTNFYWCWISIEFLMLIFIGVSYTLFYNSFSSLLVYFLVQAFSSFSVLIFYVIQQPLLFTVRLLLKLSIFPFHSWFINSVYNFPNFIVFLSSTLHKLPIFIMLILYSLPVNYTLLWFSILLTFFISGFLMISTHDFRLLLIYSSVGNNRWLLISSFSGVFVFLLFFFTYLIRLLLIFVILGSNSKPFSFVFHKNLPPQIIFIVTFVSLSGLPPYPLFFIKIYLIYNLFFSLYSSSLFLLVIFSSSFLLIGYLRIGIKFLIYSYSNVVQSIFILKD